MSKRLYRSNESKVIAGVCGGLGEHFDVDPTWFRLLFVLLVFASLLGVVAYLIGWIVIPRRVIPVTADAQAPTAQVIAPDSMESASRTGAKRGVGYLPGLILIGLGLIFLFRRLFFWFDFEYIWPLILIGIGVALIFRAVMPSEGERTADESPRPTEVNDVGR